MKYSEFTYTRPDIDAYKKEFGALLKKFREASSAEVQNEVIREINSMRKTFSTMENIAHINHTMNTEDKTAEAEITWFDENGPEFQGLVNDYYAAITSSSFEKQLRKKWGNLFFDIAQLTMKTFSPEVLDDLKKENQLRTGYTKLLASARIQFRGEEYNLQGIYPFTLSTDRKTRKEAQEARWKFFSENSTQFDKIYDDLVKLRHNMALKLGFQNFVELGYARMQRVDYDKNMVAKFRKQVEDHIVPLAVKLNQRQAKRMGMDSLKYYDLPLKFNTGNATPKGDPEWILNNGIRMYEELSEETGAFFNYMMKNELLDVLNRQGKAPGGYCTFIPDYESPFIFANFNGTAGDIDVLTHEAGHAFQVWSSRHFELEEYYWPTTEACEIHSMSMEFFTWPWMERFFKEDVDKYKFNHLSGSLLFLPYGVTVDEFQHFVYENPNATPAERNAAWRRIELKYAPDTDYDGNEYLESGGFWQKQAHIYEVPFYYIDYTLAQICAFQFWLRAREDQKDAFNDYVRLCKKGGSDSFLGLVEYANLKSPFEDGCVSEVVKGIDSYLATVDDSKM